MKKIISPFEYLKQKYSLFGKILIDVGCGTGEMVKSLNDIGAVAFGIDTGEMLLNGGINTGLKDSNFRIGTADKLPFENDFADYIFYCASFHHIPDNIKEVALEECRRVLKVSGKTIFIEPVPTEGSYYDILKLAEDEKDILANSYKMIKKLSYRNFIPNIEEYFYMERSFLDYEKLINIFVNDDREKKDILSKAKQIIMNICKDKNLSFIEYRFKSVCRVNIFVKN